MSKGRKLGDTYKTHTWPDGYRECVSCSTILPFSMFHKHAGCFMGVNTVCKACRKPKSKTQWGSLSTPKKMLQRCKSRALLKGLEYNLTIDDISIPEVCPVLLVPFDTSNDFAPSVDRINSQLGYIKGNVQIMSNKANRMKSDATIAELHLFAKWVERVCEI